MNCLNSIGKIDQKQPYLSGDMIVTLQDFFKHFSSLIFILHCHFFLKTQLLICWFGNLTIMRSIALQKHYQLEN